MDAINRRSFVKTATASTAGLVLIQCRPSRVKGDVLNLESLLGGLQAQDSASSLPGARWYAGDKVGDGLSYTFPAGWLKNYEFITADMLLGGKTMCAFLIRLQEGEDGPTFALNFKLLNQCTARVRCNLAWLDQNVWKAEREGAWLKPIVGGDRVDLANVDRMMLTIFRNGEQPVRFCITDMMAARDEPVLIQKPTLPEGKLIDEMGQSTLHEWSEKSKTRQHVSGRLHRQKENKEKAMWPLSYSKWGGWIGKFFRADGFFRKEYSEGRWWLIDPDGHAFWSAGCDCIRVDTSANYQGLKSALTWIPENDPQFADMFGNRRGAPHINYLAGNFIHAFGADTWYDKWADLALSHLRSIGFNTVGNWSDWPIARKSAFPYVRPLTLRLQQTKRIYRDFPDVFAPSFQIEAKEYAKQLEETKKDPALIGYFLMNEPTWGFSSELPASGMLFNTEECFTRRELTGFLQRKYATEAQLSSAWNMEVTFDRLRRGRWTRRFTPEALDDLAAFSELMCDEFFRVLTTACKEVDPHHMNLGARYHKVPPPWALSGMRHFDVFSMNCYRDRIPHDDLEKIHQQLDMPTMIGEFHFGALDVGLPATGIGHVKDQSARGAAYRVYVEDAAADPNCVGTHWFTLYDQSALGRFDGENYNIGFLDVCNKPYEDLVSAAKMTHSVLYDIVSQKRAPFNQAPRYFDKLF